MTRTNRILAALLVLHMIIGASYAVLTPLWQGHEKDYYTVAQFVVTERRFPTAADYPAGDAEIRQATQPPLYFLVTAPIVALFDDGQPVPYGFQPLALCPGGEQVNRVANALITNQAYNSPLRGTVAAGYLLRILNVLLGAAAVFFTYKAGQVLFPSQPVIALIGAALLALEPVTLQFIPAISNDTLLLTVCAILMFLAARAITRDQITWRDILLLIGFALAAPLVKLPGWAALAMAILVLAYRVVFRSRGRRILLLSLCLVAALTLALAWFNYQNYGSVLGRYSFLDSRVNSLLNTLNVPGVVVSAVVEQTQNEFGGPLSSLRPRAAFVTLYNLMLIVCAASVPVAIVWALIKREGSRLRAYGLLTAFVVVTFVMVVLRNTVNANVENTTSYNLAMIFTPLRYYVSMLPALALLVAAALGAILPRFSSGLPGVVPAIAFGLVSVGVAVMLFVNRPPAPTIDPPAFAITSGIMSVDLQSSADTPRIVGYKLQEEPEAGYVDLTLYLTLDAATDINYVARAELSSGESSPTPCEFLPTGGNYPTPRWEPQEIVVTQAQIPNCDANMAADTRLTLHWLGYSLDGKILETTAPMTLANLDQPLARSQSCPANLGVVDERFQLVKWNSPPDVNADELYLPSVNWLIYDPAPVPLERVFQFTHEPTGTTYPCGGTPSGNPVQTWEHGEYIYFDQCQMHFPPDAPKGMYTASVGIQTLDGELLPALTPDGEPVSWLPAGQVSVR